MTAEPDLPINDAVPAPTKIEPGNLFLWNWRQMQVYAQACVAHATAAKDAEIEALRERAERLAEALRKLEEREQSDEALLRQALEALEQISTDLPWELTGLQADTIAALRERLGSREYALGE